MAPNDDEKKPIPFAIKVTKKGLRINLDEVDPVFCQPLL